MRDCNPPPSPGTPACTSSCRLGPAGGRAGGWAAGGSCSQEAGADEGNQAGLEKAKVTGRCRRRWVWGGTGRWMVDVSPAPPGDRPPGCTRLAVASIALACVYVCAGAAHGVRCHRTWCWTSATQSQMHRCVLVRGHLHWKGVRDCVDICSRVLASSFRGDWGGGWGGGDCQRVSGSHSSELWEGPLPCCRSASLLGPEAPGGAWGKGTHARPSH